MAWFGTRTYVGAQWSIMRAADLSMSWTEISAANPFPGTVAVAMAFRRVNGTFDPRFFLAQTVGPNAQAKFLVRDLTIPNAVSGWFLLTSTPTPVVPAATIFWAQSGNGIETTEVPIQQLAADGFPLGDAAAAPPPPVPPASFSHPPATQAWAHALFGEERSQAVLELFERVESAAAQGAPVESSRIAEGVLVDDEVDEFRHRFPELRKQA
jgi:hypothetical protein